MSKSCQYRKLEVLGMGANGKVYRCAEEGTTENVAVKVIKMQKSAFKKSARREMAAMKRLRQLDTDKHSIVSLIEHFTHKNDNSLVYELLVKILYEVMIQRQLATISVRFEMPFIGCSWL